MTSPMDDIRSGLIDASNAVHNLDEDHVPSDAWFKKLDAHIDAAMALLDEFDARYGPGAEEAAEDAYWESRISEALGK